MCVCVCVCVCVWARVRARVQDCITAVFSVLVAMCLFSHVPLEHPDSISISQSWWLFLKQDFQPIPLMPPDRELAGGDVCVIFLLYTRSCFLGLSLAGWSGSEWTSVVCQFILEECVRRWDSLSSVAQPSIWPDWFVFVTLAWES